MPLACTLRGHLSAPYTPLCSRWLPSRCQEIPSRPDAFPIPDEYGDVQQQLGVSRPPLVVTLARAPQHFLAALDQRGAQIDARAGAIAQDKIDYERWSQRCQERAIHGDY